MKINYKRISGFHADKKTAIKTSGLTHHSSGSLESHGTKTAEKAMEMLIGNIEKVQSEVSKQASNTGIAGSSGEADLDALKPALQKAFEKKQVHRSHYFTKK